MCNIVMQVESFPSYLAAREKQYGSSAAVSCLYPRMALDTLLQGHRGCVNHVQFNESGESESDHGVAAGIPMHDTSLAHP
jgi:hypothetical protein